MEYKELCTKVIDIAKNVGGFIRSERNKVTADEIETKGTQSFVTYVDKHSEKMLVEKLLELIPRSGFIVEEETIDKKDDEWTWIIDPLDGTTNFIHGVPPFAISIGLMRHGEAVLGVVYEITLDECFYAWKDGGAFLNGEPIKVSSTGKVIDSLIATGFPYYDFSRLEAFMHSMEYFFRNSHGVRRLGSAATDLAYVACGRYEAFYEYSLSSWDVYAGALIVEEAGGVVADFSGGKNYVFGKELVAANKNVFPEFQQVVENIMVNKQRE